MSTNVEMKITRLDTKLNITKRLETLSLSDSKVYCDSSESDSDYEFKEVENTMTLDESDTSNKRKPRKILKLCEDNDNDWLLPSLDKPLSASQNDLLHSVKDVKSKYCAIVYFWFPGIPTHCPHWTNQFGTPLTKHKVPVLCDRKHWDLFCFWFGLEPNSRNIKQTPLFTSFEQSFSHPRYGKPKKDDIFIQIGNYFTLVLRPCEYEEIKNRNDKEYDNMIQNLMFGTHDNTQVNIYEFKNVRHPIKAWILHLILAETKMRPNSIFNDPIHFWCKEKSYHFQIEILYQSLYVYYSSNTSTNE